LKKTRERLQKFVIEGEQATLATPGAPPPTSYNFVESQYSQQKNTPLSVEIKSGSKYEPFDVGKAVKEPIIRPVY